VRYLIASAVLFAGCAQNEPTAVIVPETRPVETHPQWTGLKACDRIVFLGASNVKRGTELETGFVRLIEKEIWRRHPQLGIRVFGSGVDRNTLQQLQERLDVDVLSLKPTLVVIDCGVNDVDEPIPGKGMTSSSRAVGMAMPPKMRAKVSMTAIVRRILAKGAQVVICTPSIVEKDRDDPVDYNRQLDEFAEGYREVAKEQGAKICELRGVLSAYKKQVREEPEPDLTIDGVHYSDHGNALVARTILNVIDPPHMAEDLHSQP
jgi:lysophospholipase L1-like esterase